MYAYVPSLFGAADSWVWKNGLGHWDAPPIHQPEVGPDLSRISRSLAEFGVWKSRLSPEIGFNMF